MRVIGVDEVGRGPLAGPVVAAAALFKEGYSNSQIGDSKKLSAKKREQMFKEIQLHALDWVITSVSAEMIDRINIREAAKLAMSAAVAELDADLVLVDGNMSLRTTLPQRTVVGGDRIHVEISAASILAKVWRDQEMARLDGTFPGYGFTQHAGYPTKSHKQAVANLGPSPIHRKSFKGVREHTSFEKHTVDTPSWSLQDAAVVLRKTSS